MNSKTIEKVIVKYLIQEADSDDLNLLSEWIQIPENQLFFENYVKVHYKITLAMSNPGVDEIKKNLLKRIKTDQNKVRKLKLRKKVIKYAVAAVFTGVLVTSYFFRDNVLNNPVVPTPIIVNTKIEPGTDKATLTLEDGSIVALEKGSSFQTKNANSNGEGIVYKPGEQKSNEIVYNYITIPRGGQFFIKLSDGTKVWLNSESQLKYPVAFADNKTRRVELVYGEAYFDVSPSAEHQGTKFMVFNNSQEVEVVGTEFNIKAYKDETNIYTTLVEGKVEINTSAVKQSLIPNQQSNVDIITSKLSVAIVDVYAETSWKNGIFSFKGKPLKDIMKVLSRWYDIEVIFKNKDLEDITFKGVLGKDQNIEEILLTIKTLSVIEDYKINNKTILLK